MPSDRPPDSFRIGGWQLLDVSGVDAAAFLQRQTMNDVTALRSSGDLQWNGLLNPKGRVQALFLLLRRAENAFWLITPDLSAVGLGELLQRFVLRSRLTVEPVDDASAWGRWCPEAVGVDWASLRRAVVDEAGARFDVPAGSGARQLQITRGLPVSAIDADAEHHWRLDDLRCGLPRLPDEQFEQWTPQMLSLERLGAYSLRKGCYPGQEIVARTHYLGRSKRRLLRVDAEQPIDPAVEVFATGGDSAGNTICNASWRDHHTALLVSGFDYASAGMLVAGGVALRPMPFAGGKS